MEPNHESCNGLVYCGWRSCSAASFRRYLICRDGRELSGEVKQTATGYIIKTKVAEFELRSDEVKE